VDQNLKTLANHPRWVINTSSTRAMWTMPNSTLHKFLTFHLPYSSQPIQLLYSLPFSQILSLIYSLFLLPSSPSKPCLFQISQIFQISTPLLTDTLTNTGLNKNTQIKLCNPTQNHHSYSYFSSYCFSLYLVYHLP